MNIDFLKPYLGDELYTQVSDKLSSATGLTLANIADGSYIPKAKYDDERNKVKTLNAQVGTLTTQLEEAQKSAGDTAALNDKIVKLMQDVSDRDTKLANIGTDYSIKDALRAAKARDVDIVFNLLDRSKITSKDGKLNGVDEQIKAIRESKGFLFEAEDSGHNRGGFGGQQDIIGGAAGTSDNSAMNNAIRSMSGRG